MRVVGRAFRPSIICCLLLTGLLYIAFTNQKCVTVLQPQSRTSTNYSSYLIQSIALNQGSYCQLHPYFLQIWQNHRTAQLRQFELASWLRTSRRAAGVLNLLQQSPTFISNASVASHPTTIVLLASITSLAACTLALGWRSVRRSLLAAAVIPMLSLLHILMSATAYSCVFVSSILLLVAVMLLAFFKPYVSVLVALWRVAWSTCKYILGLSSHSSHHEGCHGCHCSCPKSCRKWFAYFMPHMQAWLPWIVGFWTCKHYATIAMLYIMQHLHSTICCTWFHAAVMLPGAISALYSCYKYTCYLVQCMAGYQRMHVRLQFGKGIYMPVEMWVSRHAYASEVSTQLLQHASRQMGVGCATLYLVHHGKPLKDGQQYTLHDSIHVHIKHRGGSPDGATGGGGSGGAGKGRARGRHGNGRQQNRNQQQPQQQQPHQQQPHQPSNGESDDEGESDPAAKVCDILMHTVELELSMHCCIMIHESNAYMDPM